LILDLRKFPHFSASPSILPTAQFCTPERLRDLILSESPREVVVYCVYGHEVSQEAAKQLQDAGWFARFLQGGFDGGEEGVDAPEDIQRWRSEPLPVIRKRMDLGVAGERSSLWITRARPKIDRIACPWLVRRFIDARAEFAFVPEAQVMQEAISTGAIPFDIEGAFLSHSWERCTFDALLHAFDIRDPALVRLAAIVRGADTSRMELAKEAAGLLAISLGLSRLYEDDHAMLEAAIPLYDALYAWCKNSKEQHNWRAHVSGAAG
jgi:rhodanese-related sulfurtransferase